MEPESSRLQIVRQARRTADALRAGEPGCAAQVAVDAADLTDELLREHLVVLRASNQLACVSGCSHCCIMDVAASFPEMAHVAATVEATFTPEAMTALRERLAARKAGDDLLLPGALPLLGRACPLLVDGLCSIYDARPLACRGWNSSDVAPCIAAAATPEAQHFIPVHRLLRDTAHAISAGTQDGARACGLDDAVLDLPRALTALLDDREGVTQAWLDGRMLPEEMHSRATGSRWPGI